MPLSEPSGGSDFVTSIAGGLIMSPYALRNTGVDTTITFANGIYDSVNQRIILTGDSNFVGTMADATAKLIQAPANPVHSAALSQAVLDSGRVVVAGGNDVSLSDDAALTSWTDITPPAVITRRGIFTFAGSQDLYSVEGAVNPEIEVSTDLGVTWTSGATNLTIPGFTAAPNRISLSPDRTRVAISSNTQIAFGTKDEVDAETMTVLALDGFLAINSSVCQWSQDNSRIVVAAANGSVNEVDAVAGTITNFALADNRFRQTASNGLSVDFGIYSAELEGFVLGNTSQEILAYLPDSAELTMQQGIYTSDTFPTLGTTSNFGGGPAMVDVNGLILVTGSANRAAIFVPGTG